MTPRRQRTLEPRAVAVSCYGWLETFYGWLAGYSRLTAASCGLRPYGYGGFLVSAPPPALVPASSTACRCPSVIGLPRRQPTTAPTSQTSSENFDRPTGLLNLSLPGRRSCPSRPSARPSDAVTS